MNVKEESSKSTTAQTTATNITCHRYLQQQNKTT